jgi:hypothetical protein
MPSGQFNIQIPVASGFAPGGGTVTAPGGPVQFQATSIGGVPTTPSGSVNTCHNLLLQDNPSLLTEWELLSINLPCGLAYQGPDTDLVTVTFFLKLNDVPVWQNTQVGVLANSTLVTGGDYWASLSVNESFINPIRVTRANKLSIDANIIMPGTTAVAGLWIGYQVAPTSTAIPSQVGAILYQVNDLPGIRNL